jgi:tyrosinase
MAYTRKNVWELGGDWADPILWYARGVKAMKARALKEPTAWRFYGAIHGIDQGLWRQLGYLSSADPASNATDVKTFWKQCQHGSWYFLPWHRGYLIAFEANIRAAVAQLPGAPTDWALPYWNYFKPGQDALPPAFASPDWPDGKGDNPLYVPQRYGPDNNGKVYVPTDQVNLDALGDPDFIGPGSGGSQGFGGVVTGFSHGDSKSVHGGVETQPHDMVHGLVGGSNRRSRLPGLMSDPDTAGLDPIFWLHHANIDRLWEVWRQMPASQGNPTAPHWLEGPPSVGDPAFVMPMPDGQSWTYTPGDMTDLSKLGYGYDDVAPAATPQLSDRLRLLSPAAPAPSAGGVPPMATPRNVELLGANKESVRLVGREARTTVALDDAVKRKVTASLTAATEAAPPDRVFLNLENVRGLNDATVFSVYINLPEGEDPAQHPECRAGSLSLFGVRKATLADQEHAGNGLTFVLEITRIIDRLHLAKALDAAQLDVRLVPRNPVDEASQVSIGRISVFRQGA